MTNLERGWTRLVLSSFAGAEGGFAVREEEVDYVAGAQRFLGAASEKAKIGVRLALLLVVTSPVWMLGRLRGLASLSREERSRLLDEMLRHRVFFVRELCLLLKLVACMCIFRSPAARERSGFDVPEKRALNVLSEENA